MEKFEIRLSKRENRKKRSIGIFFFVERSKKTIFFNFHDITSDISDNEGCFFGKFLEKALYFIDINLSSSHQMSIKLD